MSQEEAEFLINTLKELLSKHIDIPNLGKRNDYEAIDIDNKRNKFDIYIRRGSMDPNKCTFIILTRDTKVTLMRLDVVDNQTPHKNPDGKIIYGTHLHVFKDGYETAQAISFDINDPNLLNYCIEFLKAIHIININEIKINEQTTIFN